jgi:hypothetical protein
MLEEESDGGTDSSNQHKVPHGVGVLGGFGWVVGCRLKTVFTACHGCAKYARETADGQNKEEGA